MKRGAGHTVDGLRHLACSTHTPGNQIQLTLKDHFRVVKPRLAVEGMIKHSFEPGKARSLPADHEDAITAFMGFHAGTGKSDLIIQSRSRETLSAPLSDAQASSAATNTDIHTLPDTGVPVQSLTSTCSVTNNSTSTEVPDLTLTAASTFPAFATALNRHSSRVVETPKLFLHPPPDSLHPLTTTRSVSRFWDAERFVTSSTPAATEQLSNCASAGEASSQHQTATVALPMGTSTEGTPSAGGSVYNGGTGSLVSWLLCPGYVCSDTPLPVGSRNDDCSDDAVSRGPTAVPPPAWGSPSTTAPHEAMQTKPSSGPSHVRPSSADMQPKGSEHVLDQISAGLASLEQVEYQSRFDELLYGMLYAEEPPTADGSACEE